MRANFINPDIYTERYKVTNSPFAQTYHVMPRTGLLNDPNGLIEFHGEYHLFYQTHPFAPKHDVKYWFHLVTNDLIHWRERGFALKPEFWYEIDGCCSGSAIEKDGRLYLFYTGKVLDSQRKELVEQYQAMAVSDNGETFIKSPMPLIGPLDGDFSAHFRDPKVWKHGETYYMIVAAQTKNRLPRIIGYSSSNLMEWTHLGYMKDVDYRFGYMWECPGFAHIEDKDVLFICPQGATYANNLHQNMHISGYLVGRINYDTFSFEHEEFHNLDYGFEYYASYVYSDSRGRHLCVGWLGLPGDINYPTSEEGWLHCLSIMTELVWKDGLLYRRPITEFNDLFCRKLDVVKKNNTAVFIAKAFRLKCIIHSETTGQSAITLRSDGKGYELLLHVDFDNQTLTLDRSHTKTNYATIRSVPLNPKEPLTLDIFIDTSSVEVFVNNGCYVMSGRIFMNDCCTINTINNMAIYESIDVFTL